MEYDICTAEDPDVLVDIVTEALTEGWEPLGGHSTVATGLGVDACIIWSQVIVRKKAKD